MPVTSAHVGLTSGFSRRYTNGVKTFDVEATTVRGLLKAMDQLYPGLGEILEEETAIAVDGELHEVVYTQVLRPGCEVFFIPRIEGG